MKGIILLTAFLLFGNGSDITESNFDLIKKFILEKGEFRTYCNMYNNNPYYKFNDLEFYLNPSHGSKNINCDPKLSDFDEIVIRNSNSDKMYVDIELVDNKLIFDKEDDSDINNYFGIALKEIKKIRAKED